MFAAILDLDGRPVQDAVHDVVRDDAVHRVVVDDAGCAAFIHVNEGRVSDDVEQVAVARLRDSAIVGRIRLDARSDLRQQLAVDGLSDAELCLHAHARWGEDFLAHLAGDFSFVLWDGGERRLLAARDQIGIRPLFHARIADRLFVGDSLDWIAARAEGDLTLDDRWIADYLTVNHSRDPRRTVYREIRRLPSAHVLEARGRAVSVRRYWQLNIVEPVYFRDRRHYGERFRELLGRSIADRLPQSRAGASPMGASPMGAPPVGVSPVGISMSGGLDSTTLAATAVDVTGDPSRVVAECDYFEKSMPDDEQRFASLAARHLGIDLQLRAFDDLTYDPQWRSRPYRQAEPSVLAISAHHDRMVIDEMAGRAAVWLYGEGPDNALRLDRHAYFSWLRRRGDWRRLVGAAAAYTLVKGIDGWRASAVRLFAREDAAASENTNDWLVPDLVESVRRNEDPQESVARHAWHPEALASIGMPVWQRTFGDLDADSSAAFTWRHPFFDLRVLEYMLSVPPVPWAWQKQLLREAMDGRLPKEVLRRKKTPLAGSPIDAPIRRHGLPELAGGPVLQQYVALDRLRDASRRFEGDLFALVAAHALDHWLSTHGR